MGEPEWRRSSDRCKFRDREAEIKEMGMQLREGSALPSDLKFWWDTEEKSSSTWPNNHERNFKKSKINILICKSPLMGQLLSHRPTNIRPIPFPLTNNKQRGAIVQDGEMTGDGSGRSARLVLLVLSVSLNLLTGIILFNSNISFF